MPYSESERAGQSNADEGPQHARGEVLGGCAPVVLQLNDGVSKLLRREPIVHDLKKRTARLSAPDAGRSEMKGHLVKQRPEQIALDVCPPPRHQRRMVGPA